MSTQDDMARFDTAHKIQSRICCIESDVCPCASALGLIMDCYAHLVADMKD